ncbi:MAG: Vps62-related protein, partial [Acidobacteria bacterium]|nr:Vps62-related protein [Acidobacteriota bacterium]
FIYECVESGWEPRAGSAQEPCWGRDLDRDGLPDSFEDELLERFAPIVHLHPDDEFRPSSVDFYLPQVRMRYHRDIFLDHQALDYGEVTTANIAHQSYDGVSSGYGTSGADTNWFLEALHESRGGQAPAVVPCYGHARKAPGGETGIDLQYWFFYPFNGDITGTGGALGAEHEGDWEHVTIWVDDAGTTRLQTYMSRHRNEGEWYEDYELEISGEQVHVYSAIDSHASYPAADEGQRPGLPDDHTAGGGPVWNCRTAGGGTINMGELLHSFPGNEWLDYSGRWGDDLEIEDTAHSPRGPAYQSRWWNDDN